MKKKIVWLLVCSLLVGLAALSGCSNGAIRWKEPVVESAVRDYLGKAEGDIFPEDLAGITSIALVGDECFIDQPFYVQTVSARTGDAILNVETGACRTSQGDSPSTLRTLADFAHFPDLEDLHLYDMSFSSLEGVDQLAKSESLRGLHLCFNSNLTNLKGLGKLDQLTTPGERRAPGGAAPGEVLRLPGPGHRLAAGDRHRHPDQLRHRDAGRFFSEFHR